jgi:exosortase/archaeosortase family protein
MGLVRITVNVNPAVAVKITAIVATILTIFFQDLMLVFTDALRNGTASYVLTIPFIFAYLAYRKRKMLGAVVPLSGKAQSRNIRHLASIAGILLTTTAVLLYWYGSYTFTPLGYHMFALPLFAVGLCLFLFNAQTLRQLVFPVAFLFFLVPPPSQIVSILGVIIFATFIAYIARNGLWRKIALLIIGIPIIFLLNTVRLTTMLLIGDYYNNDLALQMFRLLGDWILLFVGTLLLLIISERTFKTHIFAKPTKKCLQCNPKPLRDQDHCRGCGRILRPATAKLRKSDIAKLAAIFLVASLLLTIHIPVFTLTQGAPIIAINTPSGQQFSAQILPQTDQYALTFLYRNIESEAQAKLDLSLVYLYTPLNQSSEPIWASVEIAPTQSYLHPWETDLVAPKVSQIDLQDIQLTQNPQIISRYFVFNYAATNKTQAVLYWFDTTAFMVNLTSQEKHVKISLIAYPQSIDQSALAKVELQLVTLATAIANYWQQIKTWSQITLFISQNGITLSTATAISLCLTIIYYEVETGKRRKASIVATGKLASPSREIVKAVQETKKPATLENVSATLRKTVAQRMTTKQLEQRLGELEKGGIIRSSVYSRNDEPVQTWKT